MRRAKCGAENALVSVFGEDCGNTLAIKPVWQVRTPAASDRGLTETMRPLSKSREKTGRFRFESRNE